jgi:hypothetical protein
MTVYLFELKQHKLWSEEECLDFLDQRKQGKMQWVQDRNQSNIDNLNTGRSKASRQCRNKKKKYMKATIDELETNSKIKNIRDWCSGISDFKKSYWPRTNRVKNEKGDLVADCHSISATRRTHFSQLLNVQEVNNVDKNTNSKTNSAPENEIDIEKLKIHKLPGTDQITAEMINPFQSNFSANRILPSSYLFWAVKRLVDYS